MLTEQEQKETDFARPTPFESAQRSVDLSICDRQGNDPLFYAEQQQSGKMKQCLIKLGAKELMKDYRFPSSSLDRLRRVLDLVPPDSISGTRLVVDFGLARGIAYYSGIVFEMMSPDLEMSLGGGGRYDNLLKSLGSKKDISAVGAAINLNNLSRLMK